MRQIEEKQGKTKIYVMPTTHNRFLQLKNMVLSSQEKKKRKLMPSLKIVDWKKVKFETEKKINKL